MRTGKIPIELGKLYDRLFENCQEADYNRTYLQRDLHDLSNLDRLEPFTLAQKALANRSGKLINFSDSSRTVAISPGTMKRYLRYLEISYQALLISAWTRNIEKRLSKMQKVLFLDPGVCRSLLRRTGDISGHEYEAAVISEIFKCIKTTIPNVDIYHLRTSDGREVSFTIFKNNFSYSLVTLFQVYTVFIRFKALRAFSSASS